MNNENQTVPAVGTSTDSTNPSEPKKRKRAARFSLDEQVKRAVALQALATGVEDPVVKEDLATVESELSAAKVAAGRAAEAAAVLDRAEQHGMPSAQELEQTLTVVVGFLKVLPGGKAFLAGCKSHDRFVMAQNIMERLPEGNLGLPADLVAQFHKKFGQARTGHQQIVEARSEQASTAHAFDVARENLRLTLGSLAAALKRYRLSHKRLKDEPVVMHKHKGKKVTVEPEPPVSHARTMNGAHAAS